MLIAPLSPESPWIPWSLVAVLLLSLLWILRKALIYARTDQELEVIYADLWWFMTAVDHQASKELDGASWKDEPLDGRTLDALFKAVLRVHRSLPTDTHLFARVIISAVVNHLKSGTFDGTTLELHDGQGQSSLDVLELVMSLIRTVIPDIDQRIRNDV